MDEHKSQSPSAADEITTASTDASESTPADANSNEPSEQSSEATTALPASETASPEHQLTEPETASPEHQLEAPETAEPSHQLAESPTAAPERQLEAPETATPEHQLPAEEAAALPEQPSSSTRAHPAEDTEVETAADTDTATSSPEVSEAPESSEETAEVPADTETAPQAEESAVAEEESEAPPAVAEGESEAAQAADAGEQVQEATTSAESAAPEQDAESTTPEQDEVFAELLQAKAQGTPIEVVGLRRIRNGILVQYKDKQLFLPVQFISEKPNPPENEILSFIKKKFLVHVHRIFPDDRRRIVVTRKEIIRQERLAQLQEGEIVEGRVTGFTAYGVFVDLGGVEGMVHISNLAPRPPRRPQDLVTLNEKVKVRILSIDRETGRIALSMKEFMRQKERELLEKRWPQIVEEFQPGTRVMGTVRRVRETGVWVELKPGVEGWLRVGELSWARRIQHPSEMVKPGDQLEVEVIGIDEERKRILLSHRRTQPNPWETIEERFPIGTRLEGTVTHILEKGAVVNLTEDVDAFLPRSKMLPELQRKQQPFEVGEQVEVLVMDVEPDKHSLIVGMEGFDRPLRSPRPGRRGGRRRPAEPKEKTGRVRLMDLLSEEERRKLFGEPEQSEETPGTSQDTPPSGEQSSTASEEDQPASPSE